MQLPIILEPPFRHERGRCWRVKLPEAIAWAADMQGRQKVCPLEFLEDSTRLGPGHSAHADIANNGSGRFSVWSDGWLYFSTSDNADPNSNGRVYELDLSEVAATPAEDRLGPAVLEVARAVRALPAAFTPGQGYEAVRRGLGVLYPAGVLNFNEARLAAEFADLELVAGRYTADRTALLECETAFLSIFCAGRTWVRYFLQTYLEAVTATPLSLVPRTMARTEISPSICFTHDFLTLFEAIAADPWIVFEDILIGRPLILLTRDIRDLAVSRFHHLKTAEPAILARHAPTALISDVINSPILGIERLACVQEQQRELFERHPGPKLHLTYEQLRASPQAEFERLLTFVSKRPVHQAQFDHALRKSSFREMQAFEIEISRAGKSADYGQRLGVDNWSGDLDALKVRAGKVGRFREVLGQLADPAVLASRYPITNRTLRHRAN